MLPSLTPKGSQQANRRLESTIRIGRMITMVIGQRPNAHCLGSWQKKTIPRTLSAINYLTCFVFNNQSERALGESTGFELYISGSGSDFIFLRCSLCKILAFTLHNNAFSNMEGQLAKPPNKRKTDGYNSAAKCERLTVLIRFFFFVLIFYSFCIFSKGS